LFEVPEALAGGVCDGLAERLAFVEEVADGLDKYLSIQNSDTGEGDEADGGADAEGDIAQPESVDAADEGEGDAGVDEKDVEQVLEAEEEEEEDEQEGGGHDEEEAVLGSLQVLELAAPFHDVSIGE